MNNVLIFLAFALSMSEALCREFPLARTIPAKSAPFIVDQTKDYHFEFGRGSGWMGLETIAFGRDGVVTLHQQLPEARWRTASLKVDAAAIARIFEAVKTEGIMNMSAEYHADAVDGSQWILWITQGDHSKAIYFNNYFPKAVCRLAKVIDDELATAGLPTLRWKKVPTNKERLHDKPLWNSIK